MSVFNCVLFWLKKYDDIMSVSFIWWIKYFTIDCYTNFCSKPYNFTVHCTFRTKSHTLWGQIIQVLNFGNIFGQYILSSLNILYNMILIKIIYKCLRLYKWRKLYFIKIKSCINLWFYFSHYRSLITFVHFPWCYILFILYLWGMYGHYLNLNSF